MDFSPILNHPKRNEIVSKILSGISAKEISAWLKTLFNDKDENHLRLSQKILEQFIKSDFVNYEKHLNSELQAAQTGDEKALSSLKNNKTWKQRVDNLLDEKVDIKDRLNKMELLVRDRMEQVFDSIQDNPNATRGDHVLIKYFEHYLKLLETYNKTINLAPDMIIQHNHTVDYIDKRTTFLQDSIYEVLEEMDPSFATTFLDKLNEKLATLQYNEEGIKQVTGAEIQKLEYQVLSNE
jgi:hypothetical protein